MILIVKDKNEFLQPWFQLRPDENNLHEIEAGAESSAAFLDILAPPYNQSDESFPVDMRRDCDFFRELRNTSYTLPTMVRHFNCNEIYLACIFF